MFKKFRIKRGVFVFAGCIMLFSLIGFVEKKHDDRTCKKVIININNEFENYFVDQLDIQYLIRAAHSGNIIGQKFSSLNLKYLEEKIETNNFVKDAQVFNDLRGNLVINVDQMRPMARLINHFGGGAYISTDATVLPLSSKFASRAIIIGGPYVKYITDSFLKKEEGQTLLKMLDHIESDPFLKAQIAQMDINSVGEITLFPQIGKQYIEFGTTKNYELKFRKLKAFYKKILPVKGWGSYEKISLKYENQIVCE